MRWRIATTVLVFVLLTALLPAGAVATGEGNDDFEPVYLSLGTSLAAGSQADEDGFTTFSSQSSYTDQLYQRIKGRFGAKMTHAKLGCPGETTDTMTGGVNFFGDPSQCVDLYATGTQLGDALAAVQTEDVVLITIDMGANDILQAQLECGVDLNCFSAEIATIAGKVVQIVRTLRAGGYEGPILAMNYYNPQVAAAIGFFSGIPGQQTPDPVLAQLSDQLLIGFNGALAQVYGLFDVEVVDIYGRFNSGDFGDDQPPNGIPDNVDVVCDLTSMCPDDPTVRPNIHLNTKGYRVVAKAFLASLSG